MSGGRPFLKRNPAVPREGSLGEAGEDEVGLDKPLSSFFGGIAWIFKSLSVE